MIFLKDICQDNCNIAIIPFGYFEGLDRRLSNCAKFLFNENDNVFWGKVAGKICMNLTCINCLDREVKVGERVKIISEIRDMTNSVDNLSNQMNSINYEFLVKLNPNIKKIII